MATITSFLESQMFTMLGTKNEASCCQQRVVERFLKNRDYKCTLPFIAYQVKTAAFRDVILKECQKVFARTAQSSGARQRMVVLVTYRAVWKSSSVSGALWSCRAASSASSTRTAMESSTRREKRSCGWREKFWTGRRRSSSKKRRRHPRHPLHPPLTPRERERTPARISARP